MEVTSVFERKLAEYNGLIKHAAKRYRISGILEPDDLYQEGCLILNGMLSKYNFDPDSIDFRKMFKTELWHGLHHHLSKAKAYKRGFKSKREDIYDCDSLNLEELKDESLSPENLLLQEEESNKVQLFLETLIGRLDDDLVIVLNELINPKDWCELTPSTDLNFYRSQSGNKYWKRPKKVPQHAIAASLGWSYISVKRAIKRLRIQATIIGKELGIDHAEQLIDLRFVSC